jgi:hypothetical protein
MESRAIIDLGSGEVNAEGRVCWGELHAVCVIAPLAATTQRTFRRRPGSRPRWLAFGLSKRQQLN